MRDNFKREYKRQKTTKIGSNGKAGRIYCHYEELQFLKPVMELRETESNMNSESEEDMGETQIQEDSEQVEESQILFPDNEDETPENRSPEPQLSRKQQTSKKKSKQQQSDEFVDVKKLLASQQHDLGENASFTRSLVPQMDHVDPSLLCEMRTELVRVVLSFQKRSGSPSLWPQTLYDISNPSHYPARYNDQSVSQSTSFEARQIPYPAAGSSYGALPPPPFNHAHVQGGAFEVPMYRQQAQHPPPPPGEESHPPPPSYHEL